MAVDDLSLPNTFIHRVLSERATRLLRRFSKEQLLELVRVWVNNANEAPPILSEEKEATIYGELNLDEDDDLSFEQILQSIKNRFLLDGEGVPASNHSKGNIIREITLDYWSKGFNLFQVAEIESKHILEFQNKHSWTYSTFYKQSGETFVPIIEPESFLRAFQTALYPMVLGHTYITRHSELSLTIVRLQIFNPKPRPSSPLVPLRALYLAFPASSPHLLHSSASGQDLSLKAVFHALKTVLSNPLSQVTLKKSSDIPSKNLKSFATLKGISRHAASLGAWAVYAADKTDNSILSLKPHPSHPRLSKEEADITTRRTQMANLRFFGETNNDKSKKLPVEIPAFEVKLKEIHEDGNFTPSLNIRLEGDSVFDGMYKLATDGIADPEAIPDWLTGEETTQAGVVQDNGQFTINT